MSQPIRAVRVGPASSSIAPVRVGPEAPSDDAGAVVGVNRPTLLDELGDVSAPASSPAGVDLVLRRDTDGVYRLQPAAASSGGPAWGDPIRVGDYAPTDEAPVGAVHFDTSTHRIYRNGSPT